MTLVHSPSAHTQPGTADSSSRRISAGDWIVRQDGNYGFQVNEVATVTAATVCPVQIKGRYTPKRIPKCDVKFVGTEAECRPACEKMVSSKALAASERAKADERHRDRISKLSNVERG